MRTEDMPIVDITGTPHQRGRAHGEALRPQIAEMVDRWSRRVGHRTGAAADAFLGRFLTETGFRPAIARWTPELEAEVRGIAEGANQPAEIIFALQLLDEEWWYGGARWPAHCSSLALAPGDARPARVAQTLDLPQWREGLQAVLRVTDAKGGPAYVFTCAGMIGLMGVTGRGFGLCVNTLIQLSHSPKGLPVAFVVRGTLAQPDRAAATRFLTEIDHASGQNYVLGDRHGVAMIECSAGAKAEDRPGADRLWHTNHPLASKDFASGGIGDDWRTDSVLRCAALERRLADPTAPVDLAAVKSALASRDDPASPVSIVPDPAASPDRSCTLTAVIYEFDDATTLHYTGGAPSATGWATLRVA
ncbi:C45 family autoproteolytic acyltransferase/hydolase [Inquilinus limosus]|uniref:C45 family autoproteolytic acyltransferase/hydolase n=1 Tax=Inquilinus limosus TaxID=171674 RepID=UPI00041011CD|nr:C45 family peptidase [Inquilinus limosus]